MARKQRRSKPNVTENKTFEREAKGINQSINDDEHAIKKDFEEKPFRKETKRSKRGNNSKSIPRTKYGNDPMWYGISPQLLKDAGSLSFNNPLGLPVPDVINDTLSNGPMVITGIATISYLPGIGISEDNSSAVNVAARRMYTFIRHMNSGAANYDSPDLMLYCLSVASATVTYMQMVRAYGVANVYSQKNRYMPDGILQALGFDPADIRQNLADFRYHIGVAAAKLNALAIPNNLYYFARQMWLVSGLYYDNPGAKSQIYAFRPLGYYVYTEKDSAAGTPGYCDYRNYHGSDFEIVDTTSYTPKTLTTHQWMDIFNTQIAAVLESEDIGIMAGDILKAYGAGNLLSVPGVAENYVVIPQYDMEVLTQLNNCTMTGNYPVNEASCRITQSPTTGALLYSPTFTADARSDYDAYFDNLRFRKMLNIRSDDPTPEDVMVATRLVPHGARWVADTGKNYRIVTAGTEIPTRFTFYTLNYVGANAPVLKAYYGPTVYLYQESPTEADVIALLRQMSATSRFDWHPLIPVYVGLGDNAKRVDIFGDIDNYTTVGTYELQKLNETALLSLFNVPDMAQAFK